MIQSIILVINTLGLGWLLYASINKPRSHSGGIILDSCALIDGRIVAIAKSGFVSANLVIPQFVLRELQMLADGNDNHKRARARFGLETAVELQAFFKGRVEVDSSLKLADKTDELLITLAKKRSASLCTTDYNLNKVAAAEGISVLNVNELSHALRTNMLPGEEKEIRIVQKGDGQGQGVGYLEDGTMVVVDRAARLVGSLQSIIIERSLQTVAGKMCFAHLKEASNSARRMTLKR